MCRPGVFFPSAHSSFGGELTCYFGNTLLLDTYLVFRWYSSQLDNSHYIDKYERHLCDARRMGIPCRSYLAVVVLKMWPTNWFHILRWIYGSKPHRICWPSSEHLSLWLFVTAQDWRHPVWLSFYRCGKGGFSERERSLHISNLMVLEGNEASRIGYKILEDKSKVRVSKRSGKELG